MKKCFILSALISLFACWSHKSFAQVPASSYGYTALSGTYTDITGTAGLVTLPSAFYVDDALSSNIPIGFTFNYCGTDYTQLKACTNGFLSFGAPSSAQWTNSLGNLTSYSIKPALLPLWDDMGGSGGTASYVTTGTAPNRKFTIQFKNWQWYVGNNNTISFQVMLYETTNVIEYQYKQETGSLGGFSESATIGIADGAGTPTYLTLSNSTATATASSTTFTTSIASKPANGQLYRFTPPVNCSAATGFPTAATTTVSPTMLCSAGNVLLTYTPATPLPAATGVSYKWQSAPTAAGPFTDIPGAVTTTPSYLTTTPIAVNTCFRCVLMCNGSSPIMTADPSAVVTINTPGVAVVEDASRCGPGTVTLSGTAPSGSTISWYADASGGAPLASGTSYTTGYLTATTTYYAAASSGAAAASGWIGNGTTASSTPSPIYTLYDAQRTQFIIPASEMLAAGFGPGTINSMGIDVVSNSGLALNSFTIKMGPTTLSSITSLQPSPTTQVYTTAVYTPAANSVNTFTFPIPYTWDGVSNLLIETCFNNTSWSTGHTVKTTATAYSATFAVYDDVPTFCANPTTGYSSNFNARPNFQFNMTLGCFGPRQQVTASVFPLPAVDLGPDVNECVDAGTGLVLDAGVQPNAAQYLWDDNSTSQVRAVSTSGTYHVKVTNSYDCANSDTVVVILRKNPQSALGNDTTVCNGVNLVLDPGNDGIEYFWSTGMDTRTITVNSPGQYMVFIGNAVGCTISDTIVVHMEGQLPTVQGIQVTNNHQYTFDFTAVNPQNVIGYDWDFGDSSAHSYLASPQHTYPDAGNYVVVLRLSSTCGFYDDTLSAHVVGIHQIDVAANELFIYPNPSSGAATIINKGSLEMQKIEVYNIQGQVVYRAKADAGNKHMLTLGKLSSGVYTVQIYTNKGNVSRKLEIIN